MSNSPLTNAVIITFLLFFATITVGWVGAAQNPSVGQELLKLFEKEVAGQMDGTDPYDMCVKLFVNNPEHFRKDLLRHIEKALQRKLELTGIPVDIQIEGKKR